MMKSIKSNVAVIIITFGILQIGQVFCLVPLTIKKRRLEHHYKLRSQID